MRVTIDPQSLLPEGDGAPQGTLKGEPTQKAQSWGAVVSVVVIVVMVVVGAFYAWGKRVSETFVYPAAVDASNTGN